MQLVGTLHVGTPALPQEELLLGTMEHIKQRGIAQYIISHVSSPKSPSTIPRDNADC